MKISKTIRAIIGVGLLICTAMLVMAFVVTLGQHLQASAQQQPATQASPTPIAPKADKPEAVLLTLTPEEIKTGPPLWNELLIQQREYEIAISNLVQAAKSGNDMKGHSQAVLAFAAVSDARNAASAKWDAWVGPAGKAHGCDGCALNLVKNEFIKPLEAAKPEKSPTPTPKK